jgi:taurine transport system permease protein
VKNVSGWPSGRKANEPGGLRSAEAEASMEDLETCRRKGQSKGRGPFCYPLISVGTVAFLFGLWSLEAAWQLVNPAFLPSPGDVWAAFADLLAEGYKGESLLSHIAVSLRRLFLALTGALIVAVPLGLAAGAFPVVRAVIDPIIEFYRPLPPLAYYTLLILFLGIGDESKVTLLFLSAFAPLLIGIIFSVQKIPQDRLRVARSLGARSWKMLFNVVLPSCLPDILTGFRTSVGLAYATLVAAEMVAAVSGLGWLVLDASKFLRNDVVFTGVIILGLIALIMDLALRRAVKHVSPWLDQQG